MEVQQQVLACKQKSSSALPVVALDWTPKVGLTRFHLSVSYSAFGNAIPEGWKRFAGGCCAAAHPRGRNKRTTAPERVADSLTLPGSTGCRSIRFRWCSLRSNHRLISDNPFGMKATQTHCQSKHIASQRRNCSCPMLATVKLATIKSRN